MLRLTVRAEDACMFYLRTARKAWRCYTRVMAGVESRPWDGGPLPEGHGPIVAGAQYVEYVGEVPAFQSGDRFCAACAVAAGLAECVE